MHATTSAAERSRVDSAIPAGAGAEGIIVGMQAWASTPVFPSRPNCAFAIVGKAINAGPSLLPAKAKPLDPAKLC